MKEMSCLACWLDLFALYECVYLFSFNLVLNNTHQCSYYSTLCPSQVITVSTGRAKRDEVRKQDVLDRILDLLEVGLSGRSWTFGTAKSDFSCGPISIF